MTKTETHTNKTILRVLLAAAAVLILCGAAVGAVAAGEENLATFTVTFNVDSTDNFGTVSPESIPEVNAGTAIAIMDNQITIGDKTITATPNPKTEAYTYAFTEWTCNGGNIPSTVTSNLTITAHFTQTANVAAVTVGSGDPAYYTDFANAWSDATKAEVLNNTVTLKLLANVETATTLAVPAHSDSGSLTLDLNGKVLKKNDSGIFIIVNSGGNLTVKDTPQSPAATHKFTVDDNGLWSLNEEGGSESLTGGCITGGKNSGNGGGGVHIAGGTFTLSGGNIVGNASTLGGGVHITSLGNFTMNNGCIIGNIATYSGGSGGGVNVQKGTFMMTGGTISKNTATYSGGGVRVTANGTFTMSGDAKITGNTASVNGGGVMVDGTFKMANGIISENEAVGEDDIGNYGFGGGVFVAKHASFEMTGGLITNNTAYHHSLDKFGRGGGVFVDENGTLKVSGSPVIKDNKDNNDATNNVVLDEVDEADEGIILAGEFTGDIRITAVEEEAPKKGDQFGWAEDGASGEKYFTVDNSNFFGSVSDGQLVWKAPSSGSSSKSQGTSVWLTAEPTQIPTETPTPTPVPTPAVKPVAEQPTAKSPAPFLGVLAGLGCAAVVFGLRMRR